MIRSNAPIQELEKRKYNKIWQIPEYHDFSPGYLFSEVFLEQIWSKDFEVQGKSILDIGCGSGAVTKRFGELGFRARGFDISSESLKFDIPFTEGCLWNRKEFPRAPIQKWTYGFCCDVMEHIPTPYVALSLELMRQNCRYMFFSISNEHDNFGKSIGEVLHMTVENYIWWRRKMHEIGRVIDARDCWHFSIFMVECY